MKWLFVWLVLLLSSSGLWASSDHFLLDVKPGQWVEIPDSKIGDILPEESFQQPIRKIVGPGAIVGAWSGGAFDSKRNRLMVFGGGHADYCGNEWLAFDMDDLRWHLLSGPSSLEGYDDKSGKTPDGNPASRHTYNGLAYIPTTDEFLAHGGSLCNPAGTSDNRTWVGNPENGLWEFQGGKSSHFLGYTMAYDAKTDRVYESRRGPLFAYDPLIDKWTSLNRSYGDMGKSSMTGDIDPGRRNFLLIGQGRMYVFDLETYKRSKIPADPINPVIAAMAPGLAYVESIDRFVAWSGGEFLYLINPESWEVEAVRTTGLVPETNNRGTYGRFRYSKKYNGFVLVNGIRRNVYFLKMPNSQGIVYEKASLPRALTKKAEGTELLATELPKKPKMQIQSQSKSLSRPSIKFGSVWCPDRVNSGKGFSKIELYAELPNDPIGDGENNCYMEAFDTSVFSTDNKPVTSCANLNLENFPGHTCREIRTARDFKSTQAYKKLVAIVVNDLTIPRGSEPYLASGQESLVVIGTYDEGTKRPVIIKTGVPGPSTLFYWNVATNSSQLTLINLRMYGTDCIGFSDRGKKRQLTGVSLTGKCKGRFLMASWESPEPLDNRFYLKNIMARARGSHTIYLDRTYLNWVEDSIIMGSWTPGKHAAKYTGQNVVVRNSLHSNQGVHGNSIYDPDWAAAKPARGFGIGGLAPVSMASCNRAVLDNVTVVNHVIRGNSNPQAIQWQFRDALGAGCDMPRIYRRVDDVGGHDPYYGPAWYNGVMEKPSSAWSSTFWENPAMFDSYVLDSRVIQTCDANSNHGSSCYGMMSDGTYPSVRDSSSDSTREAAALIPPDWKERQRIHLSGNCFSIENHNRPVSLYNNHVLSGMKTAGKHRYDNTDKFVTYGENRCGERDPSQIVRKRADEFLVSLPKPAWLNWH